MARAGKRRMGLLGWGGKPIKVQVGHYMAIFWANVLENK